MTQFVIEVFPTRNSKKVIRHHFKDKAEVTIGSSYACDLIIHDPYVSAEHLKISKNEGLQIEDLNSENGTRFKKTTIRDQVFNIQSGDKIHIGHTKIQVFSSDHPVQPTKKINWANHLRERLTHPITAVLVFCLTCLIYVFNEWLFFAELDYFKEEIYKNAISIALMLGLAGFVFYISSLFSKHTMKPMATVSYAGLLWIFILLFNFVPTITLASSLSLYFTMSITLAFLVFGLTSVAILLTYLENGKIALTEWLSIALIVMAVFFVGFYDHLFPDKDMKLEPHYESTMPIFSWEPSEAISIKEFLEENDVVFKRNENH